MTHQRANVCMVGGGPAGLLLGLLLAKRGAHVSVLEGHETFDREFRGEVLQPSTARLLDQLGLFQYILGQPHLTLTAGRLLVGGSCGRRYRSWSAPACSRVCSADCSSARHCRHWIPHDNRRAR
jgi:2-polyprenyl-6-methoxyphenol hydroxylase-like FAD-dependent oxidoreductase